MPLRSLEEPRNGLRNIAYVDMAHLHGRGEYHPAKGKVFKELSPPVLIATMAGRESKCDRCMPGMQLGEALFGGELRLPVIRLWFGGVSWTSCSSEQIRWTTSSN